MQRRKTVKNNNRSNQQKQLCMCSTLFLYISQPLFCTTTNYNVKLQGTSQLHVLWRKCRTCSCSLFFTAAIFTLHWLLLAFLILSMPLQKFPSCSSNKKCLLGFFISRSKSLSPFFSLSFAGLPPTFSFSLFFSCSIFQICGHDNLSLEA